MWEWGSCLFITSVCTWNSSDTSELGWSWSTHEHLLWGGTSHPQSGSPACLQLPEARPEMGLHSAEWKGSRTSQQLPRTCLGNKSPSAHLQEAWPLTLSITMQSPPQPNDTASYREKSISRPSPRPLSKARGVREEGRGGKKKKASSNDQIKVYCNS